jgi:serine/threonine-protein kinase
MDSRRVPYHWFVGEHLHHRILLELGRGGMGTVYLALTRGPGGFTKLKVVKRLRPDLTDDPAFATMFLDEARLAARLNHPNIVQTNEVGVDGAEYFMDMEYLEGQSLKALLRRADSRGGLPFAIGVPILAQGLAGLHYAHQLKGRGGAPLSIVHRDVSPHNLFVTYEGAVKVLDFGIAKAADAASETRTGMLKGKLTYMAPEQAAHRPVDHRADIYAVGILLWELLARRRLWAGLGDREILSRLDEGRIDPPSKASGTAVPAELEAVCMRCLQTDPAARYATAQDAQIALESAMSDPASPREIGAYTSDLFADARRETAAQIEARIAAVEHRGADAGDADPPVLYRPFDHVSDSRGLGLRDTWREPAPQSKATTRIESAQSVAALAAATRAESPGRKRALALVVAATVVGAATVVVLLAVRAGGAPDSRALVAPLPSPSPSAERSAAESALSAPTAASSATPPPPGSASATATASAAATGASPGPVPVPASARTPTAGSPAASSRADQHGLVRPPL